LPDAESELSHRGALVGHGAIDRDLARCYVRILASFSRRDATGPVDDRRNNTVIQSIPFWTTRQTSMMRCTLLMWSRTAGGRLLTVREMIGVIGIATHVPIDQAQDGPGRLIYADHDANGPQ